MKSPILSFLNRVILVGVFFSAFLSVLTVLGAYIPLFDLLNHFQLLILIACIVGICLSFVWPFDRILQRKRAQVLLVFSLACSLFVVGPDIFARLKTTLFSPDGANEARTLRFMSYNIYMGTWDGNGLAKVVLGQNPDLVTFQEMPPNRFKRQADLNAAYPFQARCGNWRICTQTIYSKFPLSDIENFNLNETEQQNPFHGKLLAATVHPDSGQAFRIYNVHLGWPWPLDAKRTQLGNLREVIERDAEKYPLQVIAGDFNATGWSYQVRHFAASSGLERHTHFLPTFPSPASRIKGLRILSFLSLDQILTSPEIKTGKVVRASGKIGDHWPIVTDLYLPEATR